MGMKYDYIDWTGLREIRETSLNSKTGRSFTQSQIEAVTGISQRYYSKIERGDKRSPSDKVIRKLAAFFSTTPSDLLAALPHKDPRELMEKTRQQSALRAIPKYIKPGKPKDLIITMVFLWIRTILRVRHQAF